MSEQKKFNSFFQIQKYFKKLKTKNFGKYSIIFIIKPRFKQNKKVSFSDPQGQK